MSTIVNRRDLDFLLYETLGLNSLLSHPRFADYDKEAIDAIFDLSQSLAQDQFQPRLCENSITDIGVIISALRFLSKQLY